MTCCGRICWGERMKLRIIDVPMQIRTDEKKKNETAAKRPKPYR